MTQQWSLPAWVVVAATVAALLVLLALGLLARRAVRRAAAARADADARLTELQAHVTELARTLEQATAPPAVSSPPQEFVITRLGETTEHPAPVPTVAAPLFADLVLRETVVQAASLAHGVRRALAPETRHRIRFEMKREVKRSRKQRRSDLREARRAWAARERAEMAG